MFSLFTDPEAPATLLHVVMFKKFGTHFYHWEPETIREIIQEEYNTDPDPLVLDKIQAISLISLTNSPYNYYEVFEKVGKALNDEVVFFDNTTPLSAEEVCWAFKQIKVNDPTPQPYSIDVAAYVNTVFKTEGLLFTPEIIKQIYDDYEVHREHLEHLRDPEVLKAQNEKKKEIEKYCRIKEIKLKNYFVKHLKQPIPHELEIELTS